MRVRILPPQDSQVRTSTWCELDNANLTNMFNFK